MGPFFGPELPRQKPKERLRKWVSIRRDTIQILSRRYSDAQLRERRIDRTKEGELEAFGEILSGQYTIASLIAFDLWPQ